MVARVGDFGVFFKRIGGDNIPTPDWPINNHDMATGNITPGMSFEDRQKLRRGALAYGRFLTNLRHVPIYGQAARHVEHFLNGGGKDKLLSENDVAELEDTNAGGIEKYLVGATARNASVPTAQIRQTFEKTIVHDFKDIMHNNSSGINHQSYLIWNDTTGNHWFGARPPSTKWHWAMGLYYVSYGARLTALGDQTRIEYRAYIYDRYDWNHGQVTSFGGLPIRHLIDFCNMPLSSRMFGVAGYMMGEKPVSALKDIYLPNSQPYITTDHGGKDFFVGEILGSLQETGDAKAYDIKGIGAIQTKELANVM